MAIPSWKQLAAAKRADTLGKIPTEWRLNETDLDLASKQRDLTGSFIQKFLDPGDIAITTQDASSLVDKLADGSYTAVRVTTAFCKVAAVAQQINNCLHEIFFDQALERARWLDEYFQKHKMTVGPLHGIPISLKDQFHVKGVDTTMGYVGWIGGNLGINDPTRTHKVESQITSELLSLGAVLYCKTSLPQTLMFGETVNNIIGRTLNPHNQNLSCGGSSGGEAALQALGGSPLGLGSDIGGSVRIPAAFCGTCSLKPTPERISYRGAANTNPGQNTYRSTIGLMSPSLDALTLGLRSILSTKPWLRDPAVVPMPFRSDIYDEFLCRATRDGRATANPLKLGILWTDGFVTPHPPVTRGLKTVSQALQQAGHRIVDWVPPPHATAEQVHLSILTADGAHDIHTHLDRSGEPLIPDLSESKRLRDPIPLLEYQDLTLQGLDYEAQYSDYWNSTANEDGQIVDAVIMPVAPHAAVIPGKYYHVGYTETINLMNYSAVVIPVTKADKSVDKTDPSYPALNETDRLNWEAYDPDVYDGAPVGIQLVGRKFEEEKMLAIAKIVSACLA